MYGSYIQFTSANILHFHQIFKGFCDPKEGHGHSDRMDLKQSIDLESFKELSFSIQAFS